MTGAFAGVAQLCLMLLLWNVMDVFCDSRFAILVSCLVHKQVD